MDCIIDMHNCYKVLCAQNCHLIQGLLQVETVEASIVVVSGVPLRNDDKHSREMAMVALDFMYELDQFFIPHISHERSLMRIGLHTGISGSLFKVNFQT